MANIISLSSLSRSEFDKIKKNFHCSHKQLEEHIKQYAFTHQKEGLFQTYFYVEDGKYLGYVSLAIASIDREKFDNELDIPSSMKYAIPALKITRLCVFDEYIKQGVGTILIYFVKVLATTLQKKLVVERLLSIVKRKQLVFINNMTIYLLLHKMMTIQFLCCTIYSNQKNWKNISKIWCFFVKLTGKWI